MTNTDEKTQSEELDATIVDEADELIDSPISLESELDEVKAQLLRSLADYQNLQRRSSEDLVNARLDALKPFLNVLDDLQRAVQAVQAVEADANESPWVQGVTLAVQKFENTLVNRGVRTYGEVGDIFDPKLHEAVGLTAGPDGQILEVIAGGYEVGEKVIRPALVIVGESQEKETEGDDSSGNGSASVWNEL
jgi:molecular chaperone GrpE